MISRCCKADIYPASAVYSQIGSDWYECVKCELPCATMNADNIRDEHSMSDFDEALAYVLDNEKNISSNKNDRGGLTHSGISLRFLKSLSLENLRRCGIFDEVINEDTIIGLNTDQIRAIYLHEFWDHAPFEKIRNQIHCNYIFDMAVNMGIAPAIKCVQRACWSILKRWENLPDDGILGDRTIAAIAQCGFLIMMPMRAERGSYYRAIVKENPTDKEFLHGWYNRTYNT